MLGSSWGPHCAGSQAGAGCGRVLQGGRACGALTRVMRVLGPGQAGECCQRGASGRPGHSCPVPSLQVTGRAALQSTTLQSLGLTGGSAIIRWGPQRKENGRQTQEHIRPPRPSIRGHGPRALAPAGCGVGVTCQAGACPLQGPVGRCAAHAHAAPPPGEARGRAGGPPGDWTQMVRAVCGLSLSFCSRPQVCHEAMQLGHQAGTWGLLE